jgi:hypothetical protein
MRNSNGTKRQRAFAPLKRAIRENLVVYDGPSEFNGERVIAIITGIRTKSKNEKTGPMAQLWILPGNVEPHTAQQTGADASVCWDCRARPYNGGFCYVRTGDAPLAIHRAAMRGKYPATSPRAAHLILVALGLNLRLGAYGDPAALPRHVIETLVGDRRRGTWTGYTHQWDKPRFQWLRPWVMASVDSLTEQAKAKAAGWRCFRVHSEAGTVDPLRDRTHVLPGSIQCLALRGSTCDDCGACNGTDNGRGPDIAIPAHGALSGRMARLEMADVAGLF